MVERDDRTDPSDLVDALDLEILADVARGETLDAVARRLDVSERTVRRRLRLLSDRLGLDTTIEAVVWAVREGLV